MNKISNKLQSEIGITLVALVITIVVLIILTGVTINMIVGEDGIIEKAKQAKEQTLIEQYKEKIEIIKAEIRLEYNEDVTFEKLKNVLDDESKKYWINNTEVITDNGIDKIKLTTNDGYIFYITENTTEYKGKGKVNEIPSVEEILYTPQDASWQVDNIKKALDYLYNN